MQEQGQSPAYTGPTITDYGDLVRITSVVHPFLGEAAAQDLSFSSPAQTGGGTAAGAVLPATETNAPAAADATGPVPTGAVEDTATSGGDDGSGAAGGAAGGGSSLPFTGFIPGIVAAVGAGFTATGYAIRRALRR